ncbi:hypothetical protein H2200_011205 [Cladophialophora chaetospira]|uniref:Heterokaryon incompatibility domain-containing protein n=1 Tax=Cladophialophora chaetospira TaxID=386627 RepID=A0AA39CDK5_9EURO|nr:hypothetical protein H2200_011205 [Cladophialophora chaetospira]
MAQFDAISQRQQLDRASTSKTDSPEYPQQSSVSAALEQLRTLCYNNTQGRNRSELALNHPMPCYKYEPLDLSKRSIRLVRLLKGKSTDDIVCEIFHTWLFQEGGPIPYEALSYTWGSIERKANITVNSFSLPITENLHEALRHLRIGAEDRILWVDAICIDQDNVNERGHQVQLMREIYQHAEQVLIWLGQGTDATDFWMDTIQEVHRQTINFPGDWRHSAETTWPIRRQILFKQIYSSAPEFPGLEVFWQKPWWRRVWVLQEIANARAAMIVCGNKSVSAKTFALIPSIVGEQLEPHCQAVLDIMPGFSRAKSWWTEKRDLHTLLAKFGSSQATDQRDKVYALLGISSDAADTDILQVDYSKSFTQVLRDTVSFLLFREILDHSLYRFPAWSLFDIAQDLNKLRRDLFDWAVVEGQIFMLHQLRHNHNIKFEDRPKHVFQHSATRGQELFRQAIAKGDEEVVRNLLAQGYITINSNDSREQAPLHLAAKVGQTGVMKLLLADEDIEINCRDRNDQTPLSVAVQTDSLGVIPLLLANNKVDTNSKDHNGSTPLAIAVERGHLMAAELLLANKNVDVNIKDSRGQTPLIVATGNGHEAIVQALLSHENINLLCRDADGQRPLSIALLHNHRQIARLLISEMEKRLGCQHPSIVNSVRRIGSMYESQGRVDAAEKLYLWALAPSDQQWATNHYNQLQPEFQSMLGLVHDLADLSAYHYGLQRAERMYVWGLQAYQRLLGSKHSSTLRMINELKTLGDAHRDQGNLEATERIYLGVLVRFEQPFGPSHILVSDMLNELGALGNLYKRQGKLEQAGRIYTLVLGRFGHIFGPQHPSTLETASNLGNLYRLQGRHTESQNCLRGALTGFEQVLGQRHPATLHAMNNLGNLYADRGDLEKAEEVYLRVLKGYDETPQANLLAASNTLRNLGLLYRDMGKKEDACIMFQRAWLGRETILGPEHPETIAVKAELEKVKSAQDQPREASLLAANLPPHRPNKQPLHNLPDL